MNRYAASDGCMETPRQPPRLGRSQREKIKMCQCGELPPLNPVSGKAEPGPTDKNGARGYPDTLYFVIGERQVALYNSSGVIKTYDRKDLSP